MDNQVIVQMPKYKCHKEVFALKIAGISLGGELSFEDAHYAPISTSIGWLDRHNPEVGGYLVIYQDGYQSYSPTKAFEEGYSLAEEDFRNESLVYYGPHPCQRCDANGKKGTRIVKAGNGAPDNLEFDHMEGHGLNYPNHPWPKHECPVQKNN